MKKILLALFIVLFTMTTFASNNISDIVKYMKTTVKNPAVSTVGGEWTIIGMARSNTHVDSKYYTSYYNNVLNTLKEKNGILHDKKYTEYARVALAITSIGKDPTNVGGYNLLLPLADFQRVTAQGINGPIWALIALDSKNYEFPKNPSANIQATRTMYLDYIIHRQNEDGGWSFVENTNSEIDITAMALQALSNYKNQKDIKIAIDRGLNYISNQQNQDGGFTVFGQQTSESIVQVMVALSALEISLDHPLFVKNGNSTYDALMTYYLPNQGFKHIYSEKESNLMATEQALYALVAMNRTQKNQNALYNMVDAVNLLSESSMNIHKDINVPKVKYFDKKFKDTTNSKVIELASRGVISGKSAGFFSPNDTMTRAEFAATIVKSLGFTHVQNNSFSDMNSNDWFSAYVNTAYKYGIVTGVSEKTFDPHGKITIEQAIVMVVRASKLCGQYEEYSNATSNQRLKNTTDYQKVSTWALSSVAYAYDTGILQTKTIAPQSHITRVRVAEMVYNMLSNANLI